MRPYFLLPRYFIVLGWLLAVTGSVLGALFLYFDFQFTPRPAHYKINTSTDFTNEIALTLLLLGLYAILFSRKKDENDTVNEIRLNAIHWAFLVNYSLISTVCLGVFFNWRNFDAETYNLISMPIIAVGIFYYQLSKYRQTGVFKPVKLFKFYPYHIITFSGFITITIFSIAFAILKDSEPFVALPILAMTWFWCAERNECLAYNARLKIIRGLFVLQLFITLYFNFRLYYIDFWMFMAVNIFLFPTFYLFVFKPYYWAKYNRWKNNVKNT